MTWNNVFLIEKFPTNRLLLLKSYIQAIHIDTTLSPMVQWKTRPLNERKQNGNKYWRDLEIHPFSTEPWSWKEGYYIRHESVFCTSSKRRCNAIATWHICETQSTSDETCIGQTCLNCLNFEWLMYHFETFHHFIICIMCFILMIFIITIIIIITYNI